ncbi:C40 family peptidase [Corynebacterium sp. sy039]|uniref:C40 family peptidase n=1 Tax=Corynebacterium sp. sy039 TaxID=2599641 RepID=UPI0011B3921A|nr:C40 family peptidase [Corynebacterium sp. sy039]QDZ42093.1 NlpC/P60 family protein [Corynebacterium sp. sy039]
MNVFTHVLPTLNSISTLTPTLQQLTVPTFPDFSLAHNLAQQFGAPKALLASQSETLHNDRYQVISLGTRIDQETKNLAHSLYALGQQFLIDVCQKFTSQLTTLGPNPSSVLALRAQLGALNKEYEYKISQLLDDTQLRLQPIISELGTIATKTDAEHESPLSQPAHTKNDEPYFPQEHTSEGHASAYQRERGQRAVAAAKSALGTPYVWGGTSPAGFDCSGFTQWSWRQAGVELPRLAEQQSVGTPVAQSDLIPGDLLVWDGHVAMYAGNGEIIEAGDPVQISPLRTTNMGMNFKGYFRPS